MSRRLSRISLALVILISSEVWALGLGEIRLDSALNEPLRAEIELLSATPEELSNLKIGLASAETFDRYGLDRPAYLQNIQFQVIPSGRSNRNVVAVRSLAPMTEPFLTFLVEASWSRGRLLREYTILLDPPTFAPPATTQAAPAVTAPTRTAPADSGRIERPAPAPERRVEPVQPPRTADTRPAPVPEPEAPPSYEGEPSYEAEPVAETAYSTEPGGDYYVARGDTLWGITQRVRPDSRLTINQTMLAIFEANPQAFGGNINMLRAGASLRIPGADQVFQINRGDALREVQRQNDAWGAGGVVATTPEPAARPSLTLVPPDEEYDAGADEDSVSAAQPQTREQEIEARIAELESADVPQQQSLIEIRNNELAALREELARIRGEVYEPPVEDVVADTAEEPFADEDIVAEEPEPVAEAVEDAAEAVTATEATPEPRQPRRSSQPTLVDQVLGVVTNFWTIVIGALVIVGGLLFWFMRRGRDDDDEPESWQPLDADEQENLSATQGMSAPMRDDESFVVVEQKSRGASRADDTGDVPAAAFDEDADDDDDASGLRFDSLEDTFSSETAVNLDQSDPIAEADFHMAYGLYDQAADLINGALEADPGRQDLLTKLCEIYFVWGNRDLFVDAAGRLKAAVGDGGAEDWNKIVIMGQQIAGDDALFSGAAVAGATKAVDLSFEAGMEDTGALDMELIAESDTGSNEVFDIGAADDETTAGDDDGIDFDFGDDAIETQAATEIDLDVTSEATGAAETTDFDLTAEMPAADDRTTEMPSIGTTLETPTIEQQFDSLGGTSELPSLDEEDLADAAKASAGDETAEINLDELDLDLEGLDDLDDLAATGRSQALSDTGINEELDDFADVTGRNPELDTDSTGIRSALDDLAAGAGDEDTEVATDVDFDDSLLDATGVTQVISEDLKVETGVNRKLGDDEATLLAGLDDDDETGEALAEDEATLLAGFDDDDDTGQSLADDEVTLLAGLDDDDDYDFAKTEALPADVFTGSGSLDETGELPAVASTDMDLDLDDLTAALEVSEFGDTVEQRRDDATVQQPRPRISDDDDDGTLSLGPDDMSEDLHEARTMTEVGTKLDLARAYVDMGDPSGARSILEEVLDEGDEAQRQQAQQLLDSLPS